MKFNFKFQLTFLGSCNICRGWLMFHSEPRKGRCFYQYVLSPTPLEVPFVLWELTVNNNTGPSERFFVWSGSECEQQSREAVLQGSGVGACRPGKKMKLRCPVVQSGTVFEQCFALFVHIFFLCILTFKMNRNKNKKQPFNLYEPRHEKMCLRESPTRRDTNRSAQPQKLARVLKFRL